MKLKREDREKFEDIVHEGEKRTRLNMEFDDYETIYQGDVNNYVAVDYKEKAKCKGAYVKDLGTLDYDLPIVNKAIRAKLTQGIPVETTIQACDELKEFQKIVKVSSKYYAGWYQGQEMRDKTFRVFASRYTTKGPICKIKSPGAKPEKFANTPERCFIENGNVNGMKCPRELDKQWYIDLANKRIAEKFGIE